MHLGGVAWQGWCVGGSDLADVNSWHEKNQPMISREIAKYTFGRDGSATPRMIDGWSGGEDGHTWTDSVVASIRIDSPIEAPCGVAVEMHCGTYQRPNLPMQRVGIRVNGEDAIKSYLVDRGVHAWIVQRPVLAKDGAVIEIVTPDAARPCDLSDSGETRRLGVSVRQLRLLELHEPPAAMACCAAASGSDRDIALEFIPLGRDCELGLVQRAMGAEPLGLLRFSYADIGHIQRGIETAWHGLGDRLEVAVEDGEWMTRERGYDLRWHTFKAPDAASHDALLAVERRKTAWLRDAMLENMRGGDRIFIVKGRANELNEGQVVALHLALNRHARNWLLWVTEGNEPPTLMLPRLIRGAVPRFMRPGVASDYLLPEWVALLRSAVGIRDGHDLLELNDDLSGAAGPTASAGR